MSNGNPDDLKRTIKEMKHPSGLGGVQNWLRHDGTENMLIDHMLLSGATKNDIANNLIKNGYKHQKRVIQRINGHFNHLMAKGKSEISRGHHLPLIESDDGKWIFDLAKMEQIMGRPVSSPSDDSSAFYLPIKADVELAESQSRKSTDEFIGINVVLDQVEENFRNAGKPLKPNWREITKRNIEIWFRSHK